MAIFAQQLRLIGKDLIFASGLLIKIVNGQNDHEISVSRSRALIKVRRNAVWFWKSPRCLSDGASARMLRISDHDRHRPISCINSQRSGAKARPADFYSEREAVAHRGKLFAVGIGNIIIPAETEYGHRAGAGGHPVIRIFQIIWGVVNIKDKAIHGRVAKVNPLLPVAASEPGVFVPRGANAGNGPIRSRHGVVGIDASAGVPSRSASPSFQGAAGIGAAVVLE